MYAGEVVEEADVDALFSTPQHPYTEGLLASMPQVAMPGSPLVVIPGQVPNPDAWPPGCRFEPRCAHAIEACREHHGRARAELAVHPPGRAHAHGVAVGRADAWAGDREPVRHPARRGARAHQGLPGAERALPPRRGERAGRRRDRPRGGAGGDGRPRGGVGLGQVDRGASRSPAHRADGRPGGARRRRRDCSRGNRAPQGPARHADRVPGPVLVARSARHDRGDDRGATRGAPRSARQGARRAGRRAPRPSRSRRAPAAPLPARVLGRAAPAHRDRACPSRSTRACSSSTSR